MKINGSYTFPAAAEEVWDLLLDPNVLMQVIPGLESVDVQPDGNILATATVGVGPVKGKFSGKLQLLDQQKPRHVRIVGDGKGGPGFMKGVCVLDAVDQDGSTVVNYQADVQLGGTLASVGQRLVDVATNSVMQQGFARFNRVLTGRQAAEAAALAVATAQQEDTMSTTTEIPAESHADMHESAVFETFPTTLAWLIGIVVVLLSLAAYFSHLFS